MEIKEIKENYYFETLNGNHDLSDFDCGDDDMNDFLKNDALTQQESELNVTKLVIYDNNIIGFASLLTDTILIRNIRDENISLNIKRQLNITTKNRSIASVKIGRMAIDKKYHRKNLGTHIIRNIISNLKNISEKEVGFRFIVVDGYARALNRHNCFNHEKLHLKNHYI